MSANYTYPSTLKTLESHNQQHLLAFWEELSSEQQADLLTQVNKIDFTMVDQWVKTYVKSDAHVNIPSNLKAPAYYPPKPNTKPLEPKYSQAMELGKKLISDGKVAAFVVAGGQGTRLGFDGPKGNFKTTPLKQKSLFQVFSEIISATSSKFNTQLCWYIMTSPLNYQQTIDSFAAANYFGLDKKNIFIFQQGTMPNFGFDGKILMADKATIATSPDGHGGSLKALFDSGAVSDMKKRGIEYISYFQVDNPLINIFDPLFIGLHALDKAQMSSKALIKAGPFEKIGNFTDVDGKICVIEYSDMPNELAEKKNPDGSLVFALGSIAIHIINSDFVEKLNAKGFSLPFHKAVKKIPCIDEKGTLVKPAEPNGVKLESFVFDALPLAAKSIILETIREEEFGPVKNATGVDSAESSRQMQIDRACSWLEAAGVKIPKKSNGSPDCEIEMSPSFAVYPQDVKEKISKVPAIKPNDKLYLQ